VANPAKLLKSLNNFESSSFSTLNNFCLLRTTTYLYSKWRKQCLNKVISLESSIYSLENFLASKWLAICHLSFFCPQMIEKMKRIRFWCSRCSSVFQ
jgi:hypothetical protein